MTTVSSRQGKAEIRHGAVIIATGAEEYRPTEYLYGQNDKVMTSLELEERIVDRDDKVINAQTIVMISVWVQGVRRGTTAQGYAVVNP
jgi:heterodisulfide reductase subunit A